MGLLTCKINLLWEKQLIKNDYTSEELWVPMEEIPDALHSLIQKDKTAEGVWFEGPYSECSEIMYRYNNKYPGEHLSYAIN